MDDRSHVHERVDLELQAARALVYFDDAEKEPMPRLLQALTWAAVRSYFLLEVPKQVRRHLRGP